MNKIMFNKRFGLEQAVLDGIKTQTRRIVSESLIDDYENWLDDVMCIAVPAGTTYEKIDNFLIKRSRYRVGEIVAIAQSYKDIFSEFSQHPNQQLNISIKNPTDTAGWTNKMFVKAGLMPHQIRITNVRIQRLQDISYDDCLAEGIQFDGKAKKFYCGYNNSTNSKIWLGSTPREAYASLIDKLGKRGDWDSNPYVWVYDFELIK